MQKRYNTETLAELLQVSPATVNAETLRGRLHGTRLNGAMIYTERDVRDYVARDYPMPADGPSR